MMKQILNGSLSPRHREAGLELIETDDHVLELRTHNAEIVARFSATSTTILEIHKEADKWLQQQIVQQIV